MEELELRFDDEAGVYLPQVVAEENKRKANEHERLSSEEERLANEKERVENEEYRVKTMKEIEAQTDAIIDEMNANLRKISFVRRYKVVHTAEENQDTFSIPSEYTETSMLDIHVNGFTLNDTQYSINSTDVTVTLVDPVDAGTTVEVVVTRLTTAHIEDYNSLFYDDTEIKEGLEENTADIQSNEDRIIALEAENIKQKEQIEYLEKVKDQALKDHKKIPFEGASSHLQDTGELPILDFGINGGIEQDTRVGYNKVKITAITQTLNGLTLTIKEDKSFTVTGTLLANKGANFVLGKVDFMPYFDKEMTFDIGYVPLEKNIGAMVSHGYDNNNNKIVSNFWNIDNNNKVGYATNTKKSVNYDTSNGFAIIFNLFFPVVTEDTPINISGYLQLNEGGRKAYEQFGSMPSIDFPSEVKGVSGHYDTVVENKNLLKLFDIEEKTANGVTYSVTNGVFKLNGTATEGMSIRFTKDFKIKKGTYTHKLGNFKNGMYASFNNIQSTMIGNENNSYRTFTLTEDTIYPNYLIWINKGTVFNNETFIPMLEIGDTATEIVEHQEQLLPIDIPFNMYSGKAYKENGKWYRPIEWYKERITSSHQISTDNYGVNSYKIITQKKLNTVDVDKVNIISNYFYGVSYNNRGLEREYKIYVLANYNCVIRDTQFTTIEELKTFLDSNEVYVVYKLAVPEIEEIIDTTLIKQLEDMQKAHSYYEVTNINSYSNGGADLVLSGNALMSNDIRMSKLESGV